MRKYKFLVIMLFAFTYAHCAPMKIHKEMKTLFSGVSDTHNITINGSTYDIDMRRLLETTAMVESNYGRDSYHNSHAISPFQYERTTVEWAIRVAPELHRHLSHIAGRTLNYRKTEDSVYYAYLIYFAKMRYHRNWLDSYAELEDVDWDVYKVLYNSVKGKTTFATWKKRRSQFWLDGGLIGELK